MRTVRLTAMICLLLAMVVLSPLAVPTVAHAATTIWVDIASGANSNAGTSASPLRTIEAAVSVASSGDTIMVRPGIYGQEASQDFPIFLPAGVALKSTGGAQVTRLESNGTQRVISIEDATAGTTVSGFTVTDGGGDGAGIMIRRTTAGDVVGWPLIEGCIITENGESGGDGCGLNIDGVAGGLARPRIVDTTLSRNDATNFAVRCGTYSDVTFERCNVEFNHARGVLVESSAPGGSDFTECVFKYNEGVGLQVSAAKGTHTITGCDIIGNSGVNGGGMYITGCDPIVTRSRILGNEATGSGGGVFLTFSATTFTDCLVAENSAASGGALFGTSMNAHFVNSTIAHNVSPGWGGVYVSVTGAITLKNCIVWGHGGKDVYGATAIDYTCTEDVDLVSDNNTVGSGVIHDDPMFSDYYVVGWYRLEAGSPCIDAGNPADYSPKDYYGKARPIDGDGDRVARPDMGYYEFLASRVTVSAPSILSYGGKAILTARLTKATGAALSSRWVAFDYSTDGVNWKLFAQTLSDGSGWARAISYPSYSRVYFRARFIGDETYPSSSAAKVTVKPKAYVRTPIAPRTMRRSRYYSVYGWLKPRHNAGSYPVRIYKWKKTRSGKWKSYGYVYAKAYNYSSYTKYLRKIRLPYAGRWRLRAYAPGDSLHASTWSSGYDYVTVK